MIAAIPDNEARRGSIALMLSTDARLARSRAWVLRKNTSAENTTSSSVKGLPSCHSDAHLNKVATFHEDS
ncbi:hypothetical protein RCH10_000258 [Variovorax sp. GrIS 2.14]|uniref:hypothetical protein n=1 Tax=Variovorax sp. GrIS 2.14 TaxID=3071709 RepID=UPI0019B56DFA|nr:hypothetical protein [Variovorax sp.]